MTKKSIIPITVIVNLVLGYSFFWILAENAGESKPLVFIFVYIFFYALVISVFKENEVDNNRLLLFTLSDLVIHFMIYYFVFLSFGPSRFSKLFNDIGGSLKHLVGIGFIFKMIVSLLILNVLFKKQTTKYVTILFYIGCAVSFLGIIFLLLHFDTVDYGV